MFYKKINFLCASALLCTALISAQPLTVTAATADLTLNIANSTYSGTYSGDLKDDEPSGEGTFTVSTDDADFVLSGTWEDGLLEGDVEINYADGSKTTSQFKNGLITGATTEYHPDGSYSVYNCQKGKPYGRILQYNSKDQLTGYDFYYQMRTVSSLKSQSTDADYNTLLGTSFPDTPQKITGTVAAVFSSSNNCFAILYDAQSHPYVLTYANNSTSKFNQAIVPNLKEGDHITAYGYLQRQDSLKSLEDSLGHSLLVTDTPEDMYALSDSDLNDILSSLTSDASTVYNENAASTLPFILLFAADADDGVDFNINTPSRDYTDIITNPYLYTNTKYSLTGTVQKCVTKYDKGYVQMLISEKDTDNIFYVKYRYEDGNSLPATGDTVTVEGLFNGNYKKIIPAEDAKVIQNSNSDAPTAEDTTSGDGTVAADDSTTQTTSEITDDVTDDDILDEDVMYDSISYVILYPRLSTNNVTIIK